MNKFFKKIKTPMLVILFITGLVLAIINIRNNLNTVSDKDISLIEQYIGKSNFDQAAFDINKFQEKIKKNDKNDKYFDLKIEFLRNFVIIMKMKNALVNNDESSLLELLKIREDLNRILDQVAHLKNIPRNKEFAGEVIGTIRDINRVFEKLQMSSNKVDQGRGVSAAQNLKPNS